MKLKPQTNVLPEQSPKAPITGWLLAPLAYLLFTIFFRFFDYPPATFSCGIKLVSFRVNNMGDVCIYRLFIKTVLLPR